MRNYNLRKRILVFTGTNDNIAHLLPDPHFELIDTCASQSGSRVARSRRAQLQRASCVGRSFSAPENPAMPGVQLDDGLPRAIDYFPQLAA